MHLGHCAGNAAARLMTAERAAVNAAQDTYELSLGQTYPGKSGRRSRVKLPGTMRGQQLHAGLLALAEAVRTIAGVVGVVHLAGMCCAMSPRKECQKLQ